MASQRRTLSKAPLARWYRGADIPMRLIRRFARQVGERFEPQKIILFGSYAYGTPHADSDVDILVIMPARNQLDQAVRISLEIDPPFPLDIIVRPRTTCSGVLLRANRFCVRSRPRARFSMKRATREWVEKPKVTINSP
jgi:predicted nucleotidyltransferase